MESIADRLLLVVGKHADGKPTIFAKKCGIPISTFHNYTKGRPPSADHLIRICKTFGIDITWLLTGETSEKRRDLNCAPGIGDRILELTGTKKPFEWAQRIGLPEKVARGIFDEGIAPPREYLAKIAKNLNTSIDWLLAGDEMDPAKLNEWRTIADTPPKFEHKDGDTPRVIPVNIDMLKQIIEGVEETLFEQELELDADKKAQMIALLYEQFTEEGQMVNRSTVKRFLRLVS